MKTMHNITFGCVALLAIVCALSCNERSVSLSSVQKASYGVIPQWFAKTTPQGIAECQCAGCCDEADPFWSACDSDAIIVAGIDQVKPYTRNDPEDLKIHNGIDWINTFNHSHISISVLSFMMGDQSVIGERLLSENGIYDMETGKEIYFVGENESGPIWPGEKAIIFIATVSNSYTDMKVIRVMPFNGDDELRGIPNGSGKLYSMQSLADNMVSGIKQWCPDKEKLLTIKQ